MQNKTPILLFVLLFLSVPAQALEIEWKDFQNFELPDHNIHMKRPSAKWRVVEKPDQNILEMIYPKRGKNHVIDLSIQSPVHRRMNYARSKSQKHKSWLADRVLQSFKERGFSFYKTHFENNRFYAEGIDVNNNVVLVEAVFVKPRYRGGYYLLQLEISRKTYTTHQKIFKDVANSLEVKS